MPKKVLNSKSAIIFITIWQWNRQDIHSCFHTKHYCYTNIIQSFLWPKYLGDTVGGLPNFVVPIFWWFSISLLQICICLWSQLSTRSRWQSVSHSLTLNIIRKSNDEKSSLITRRAKGKKSTRKKLSREVYTSHNRKRNCSFFQLHLLSAGCTKVQILKTLINFWSHFYLK